LNELEELLELTQQEEFKQILGALFQQLSRAIGSSHFQVAERALFLWHNDYISGLIADNRRDILPIIYPVLHFNSESHWNLTVKNLTYNVLKIFMELDTPLVEQCSKTYFAKKGKDEIRVAQKLDYWTKLGADVKDKSAWLLAADKKPPPPETKERDSDLSTPTSTSTTTTTDQLTSSFSSLSVTDEPDSPPPSSKVGSLDISTTVTESIESSNGSVNLESSRDSTAFIGSNLSGETPQTIVAT